MENSKVRVLSAKLSNVKLLAGRLKNGEPTVLNWLNNASTSTGMTPADWLPEGTYVFLLYYPAGQGLPPNTYVWSPSLNPTFEVRGANVRQRCTAVQPGVSSSTIKTAIGGADDLPTLTKLFIDTWGAPG